MRAHLQREHRLRLCRRLRAFRSKSVLYALLAGALFAMALRQEVSPDPMGPALVEHSHYGTLERRVSWDVENCFTVQWVDKEGRIKFSNTHC